MGGETPSFDPDDHRGAERDYITKPTKEAQTSSEVLENTLGDPLGLKIEGITEGNMSRFKDSYRDNCLETYGRLESFSPEQHSLTYTLQQDARIAKRAERIGTTYSVLSGRKTDDIKRNYNFETRGGALQPKKIPPFQKGLLTVAERILPKYGADSYPLKTYWKTFDLWNPTKTETRGEVDCIMGFKFKGVECIVTEYEEKIFDFQEKLKDTA